MKILFFKSQVKTHQRKLKNGSVIIVQSYTNSKTKKAEVHGRLKTDDKTLDMFDDDGHIQDDLFVAKEEVEKQAIEPVNYLLDKEFKRLIVKPAKHKRTDGYVVSVPYNSKFVAGARKINGKFDKETKQWFFSGKKESQLILLLDKIDELIDDEISNKENALKKREDELRIASDTMGDERIKSGSYGPFDIELEGDFYRVSFDYDPTLVKKIKKFSEGGQGVKKYDPETHQWAIPVANTEKLKDLLDNAIELQEKIDFKNKDEIKSRKKEREEDDKRKDLIRIDFGSGDPPVNIETLSGSISEPFDGQVYFDEDKGVYYKVLRVSSEYYPYDGMSVGVGDDSGYLYNIAVVPATDEESKPLKDRFIKRESKTIANNAINKLTSEVIENGIVPANPDPSGDVILDNSDIYGYGRYWQIGKEKIWYIKVNGSEGTDFSINNMGDKIARYIPYDKEFEYKLREAAGVIG